MNDIEKILIKKCVSGDTEAFEKLIFTYQSKVVNICYRYLSDYDDAIDISQEIFIKIFKSISSFKGNSSIATWIYKIAVTTCIDELRKRKNKSTISIEKSVEDMNAIQISDDSGDPYKIYENKNLRKEIQEAINEMPEDYKMAIILRDIEGLSYNEISQILNAPLGTIKSRIKRGRESIKQYLIEYGNFFEKVSSK